MTEVAEVTVSTHSSMPGDYAKRLSAAEVTDLVAYLGKQSVRPVALEKLARKKDEE